MNWLQVFYSPKPKITTSGMIFALVLHIRHKRNRSQPKYSKKEIWGIITCIIHSITQFQWTDNLTDNDYPKESKCSTFSLPSSSNKDSVRMDAYHCSFGGDMKTAFQADDINKVLTYNDWVSLKYLFLELTRVR